MKFLTRGSIMKGSLLSAGSSLFSKGSLDPTGNAHDPENCFRGSCAFGLELGPTYCPIVITPKVPLP
jgi:hypothetical protein